MVNKLALVIFNDLILQNHPFSSVCYAFLQTAKSPLKQTF